jgi:hypothetical protein
MPAPLVYVAALLIGCFEWTLAIKRTVAVINHRPFTVAWTVFVETYLAFGVAFYSIKELSTLEAMILYGLYCIGGALGSLIPMLKSGTFKQ